jgi:DNA-binding HxlR family transcriptional regulator
MEVTIADNQEVKYKEKIKRFYDYVKVCDGIHMCPVRDVFAPSVDKWSLFVIYNLAYNNDMRFNKLKKYIPNISSRMLSLTLKKLEESKIVSRKVFAEVPPRVEYKLTEFGYKFSKQLIDLNLWVMENIPEK